MEEVAQRGPKVVVIGGPNGAGKTTTASRLLPDDLALRHFVNADVIAAGLSGFAPETVAAQAGRIMLARLAELSRQRESFAFETTLASRSFAPFLRGLKAQGYAVHVIYVWLSSPELARQRVAVRVSRGGHHVPGDVVERRYWRGLSNFRQIYRPLADFWILCDNTDRSPVIVARGEGDTVTELLDPERYDEIARAEPRD